MPRRDSLLASSCSCGLARVGILLAVLLCAVAAPVRAETSPLPSGGKPVVVPPITDKKAVKKPPEHADQDAIARPPKVEPQMRKKERRDHRNDKDGMAPRQPREKE